MKKFRSVVALLLSVLFVAAIFAGCDPAPVESTESTEDTTPKKVRVYGWNDEFPGLVQKYVTLPEGYEWEFVINADADGLYQKVLDQDLAAGTQIDLLVADVGYAQKYINNAQIATMEEIGVDVAALSANANPYTIDISKKWDGGAVAAGTWQATPGQFVYRTDLAEQYLGVKTSEEMQAKVADWDKFMATGKELYAASNGAMTLVPSLGDVWQVVQIERSTPWVQNNELKIDEKVNWWFNFAKEALASNVVGQKDPWGDAWTGSMGDGSVLGYFGCPWFIRFTLMPPAEAGGTSGKWNAIDGPQAYYWGGTYIMSAKTAKYPEIAKLVIEQMCIDTANMKKLALAEMEYVNNTVAIAEIMAEGNNANAFLGGQDYYKIFLEAGKKIDISALSAYDTLINDAFNKAVSAYAKGELELAAAQEQFKADITKGFPEITVVF
ncbi:MAG: ABC transporter substrate-binding protein [Oscillospiraceae bacterium]|jgi:hypothetical protein|nr:ABC transporter substrate-binding protein [Oscillospiraceae bacterium]